MAATTDPSRSPSLICRDSSFGSAEHGDRHSPGHRRGEAVCGLAASSDPALHATMSARFMSSPGPLLVERPAEVILASRDSGDEQRVLGVKAAGGGTSPSFEPYRMCTAPALVAEPRLSQDDPMARSLRPPRPQFAAASVHPNRSLGSGSSAKLLVDWVMSVVSPKSKIDDDRACIVCSVDLARRQPDREVDARERGEAAGGKRCPEGGGHRRHA